MTQECHDHVLSLFDLQDKIYKIFKYAEPNIIILMDNGMQHSH